MKSRCLLLALGVLVSGSLAAEAQQVEDPPFAVVPSIPGGRSARRDDRRHARGKWNRSGNRDRAGRYYSSPDIPGPYRSPVSSGLQALHPGSSLQIGETATLDVTLEVGSVAESVTGPARRRSWIHVDAGCGKCDPGRVDGVAVSQPQRHGFVALLPASNTIRRRSGPAPSTSTASTAASHLRHRRREQQRRHAGRRLRPAGAARARGHPGVSGRHEPVRRRIRPRLGRHRQCHHEAGR